MDFLQGRERSLSVSVSATVSLGSGESSNPSASRGQTCPWVISGYRRLSADR